MYKLYLTCCALLLSAVLAAKQPARSYSSQYGFIENKGQIIDQHNQPNPSVLYLWNGGGINVHLKQNSFSYEVRKIDRKQRAESSRAERFHRKCEEQDDSTTIYTHRVDVELVGADATPVVIAEGKSRDYINYYTTGTPEEGATLVHHYSKVTYKNIYPNIDMEFVLAKGEHPFKYNFIVRPGGDVEDIKLKYDGAKAVDLKGGDIVIATEYGDVKEEIPLSFELGSGNSVNVEYRVISKDVFGLSSAKFDQENTLVIDPWITYFGGTDDDITNDITTDALGNVYVTGFSNSLNNIASVGAYQSTMSGSGDAFIAKFNLSGVLQWATYYGGTGNEEGLSIALTPAGAIYIGGNTDGPGMATIGAYQTSMAGIVDGFISLFTNSGTLQWSTYVGGSGFELARDLTSDALGNVVLIGKTNSLMGIATSGSHQPAYGSGDFDAFVTKFNQLGGIEWSTYYGGDNSSAMTTTEEPWGIASDLLGNIVITGYTNSLNNIATPGAFRTNPSGNFSAFIAKFNAAGIRQWGTYAGGDWDTQAMGVAVDNLGNVIIAGETNSISDIATLGTQQTIAAGTPDVFIMKFDAAGSKLWGTYYGGPDGDIALDVAVNTLGEISIVGYTESTTGITTTGAYQTSFIGGANTRDGFVAKFNSSGLRQWATYFGGSQEDYVLRTTIDNLGNVFFVGYTFSSGLASPGAHQTNLDGFTDGFIGMLSPEGTLLKILLSDISATNLGATNRIVWMTGSEELTDRFELERSNDASSFSKLSTISAKGTASSYKYWDERPFCGLNYYRLKMYDANGTFSYSKTVMAIVKDNDASFMQVYPNPSKDAIYVTIKNNTSTATITVVDAAGKVMKTQSASITGTIAIDIKSLPAGIYIVQYEDEARKETVKLVKE